MERIIHPITGEEGFFATVREKQIINTILFHHLIQNDEQFAHSIVGDVSLD